MSSELESKSEQHRQESKIDDMLALKKAEEEERMMTCSLESMEKISRDYPQGVILIFTQEGCRYCPPFVDEVTKVVSDKHPIAESGLEDAQCMDLANKLNVEGTPTALFWKDGKERARLNPTGKTWDQIRVEIAEMVKT